MKQELLMDFSIDKETSTVIVKKEFEAGQDLVWSAWTEPELLDQWWAPSPWLSRTKRMEFKVGGQRLYAMVGPGGEEHWALADYTSISPKSNFKYLDAFCDQEGIINNQFPRSAWDVHFSGQDEMTLVKVFIKHQKLADLEMIISMGFKEGFTMGLDQLANLLAKK